MKQILAWAVAGILLGAVLLWPPGAECSPGSGQPLYNDKCALCHGIAGDGNGPAGAALDPKPTDFTNSQYWQTATDQKIKNATLNGVGVMPAFNFNDQEMQSLLDYLKTFKK